jgi:signal transduction histidine kinase
LFQIGSAIDQQGNRGNGIGLAIVKRNIERLGGEIHVQSEEGQGAEFHFSISK